MVSCEDISGGERTPLIGVYLTPYKFDNLPYLEEALNLFLGKDPIVLGRLQYPRIQQVAEFLASFGLVDLLIHLRQWMRFQYLNMWKQV